IPGAGADTAMAARCPLGTACIPANCDVNRLNCMIFSCSMYCGGGWPCATSAAQPWTCYQYDPNSIAACQQVCTRGTDCGTGKICARFTTAAGVTSRLCSTPCTGTDCTAGCTCSAAGTSTAGHCYAGASECSWLSP